MLYLERMAGLIVSPLPFIHVTIQCSEWGADLTVAQFFPIHLTRTASKRWRIDDFWTLRMCGPVAWTVVRANDLIISGFSSRSFPWIFLLAFASRLVLCSKSRFLFRHSHLDLVFSLLDSFSLLRHLLVTSLATAQAKKLP